MTVITGDRVKYNISFMEFPLFPMESNVHNHNGQCGQLIRLEFKISHPLD